MLGPISRPLSCLLIAVAVAFCSTSTGQDSEVKVRRWLDSQTGKSVRAYFAGVDNGMVTLETKKGDSYTIALDRLSKSDQKYIKKTKIYKPLQVKAEVTSQKASDLDFNIRSLKVDIKNIEEGKEVYALVVWISQLHTNGNTGIKTFVEDFFRKDGEYFYKCSFSNNRKVGESYRGYALRLIDEDGKILTERASTSTYKRYLDKAFTKRAPQPKENKGEKKK